MNTISKIGLRKLVSIAVAVFFIIEYSWAGGVYANWTSAQFGEFVNSVPTPPADCEVMYVKLSPMPDAVEPNWRLSLDAWQIAAHYDLKTINGYSGQVPPGWITDITSTNYEQSVANWVAENNLVHVYAYNLVTQQWEAPQFQ
ncbi:hypothetical protein AGMMS49983_09280 [Clostridia bacterium]|nr:hypothetical protein AGMMS49983_09280 [Clostridia bacterium]